MSEPKILIMDIENAPSEAYVWSLYTEVVSETMIKSPWYMMCWCAKWLGEKKVYSSALIDFPKDYKKDPENDKLILKPLWDLMNSADLICGHNIRRFDIRKAKARFIINGMKPPSPSRTIDTLMEARKHFYFTSNKLGDLGKYLGLGEKIDTGGFGLWKKCMAGDKKAWKQMVDYCKQDVLLTEKVYQKMLPYMETHPNLNVYSDEKQDHPKCPNCGSFHVHKRGFSFTNVSKYQRYLCKGCGAWFRGTKNLKKGK